MRKREANGSLALTTLLFVGVAIAYCYPGLIATALFVPVVLLLCLVLLY